MQAMHDAVCQGKGGIIPLLEKSLAETSNSITSLVLDLCDGPLEDRVAKITLRTPLDIELPQQMTGLASAATIRKSWREV